MRATELGDDVCLHFASDDRSDVSFSIWALLCDCSDRMLPFFPVHVCEDLSCCWQMTICSCFISFTAGIVLYRLRGAQRLSVK